jgi:hypothetical protein
MPSTLTTSPSTVMGGVFQNAGCFAPPAVGHQWYAASGADVAGFSITNDGTTWRPANNGTYVGRHRVAALEGSRTVANRLWAFTSRTADGTGGTAGPVRKGTYDPATGYALWEDLAVLDAGAAAGGATHPRQIGRLLALDEPNDCLYIGNLDGVWKVTISTGATTQRALAGCLVTGLVLDGGDPTIAYATVRSGGAGAGVYRITNLRSGTVATTRYATITDPEDLVYCNAGGTPYLFVAAMGQGIRRWAVTSDISAGWTDVTNAYDVGGNGCAGIDAVWTGSAVKLIATNAGTASNTNAGATSANGGTTWSNEATAWTVSDVPLGETVAWWLAATPAMMLDGGSYDCENPRFDPADSSVLHLWGRSGVWRSSDAGSNWRPSVRGILGTVGWCVGADPTGSHRAVVGDGDWTVLRSTDAFATMPVMDRPDGTTGMGVMFRRDTGKLALAVGDVASQLAGEVYTNPDPFDTGAGGGGGAGFTTVGYVSGRLDSGSSFVPDTWPSGLQAGDVIVLFVGTGTFNAAGPPTMTCKAPDTTDYTMGADQAQGTTCRLRRFSRVAASNGEGAPTIAYSQTANGTCVGVVLRGQDATTPIDVTDVSVGAASSGSATLPNITTATDQDLLLVGYTSRVAATPYPTLTAGADYTSQTARSNTGSGAGATTMLATRGPVTVGTYGNEAFSTSPNGVQAIIQVAVRQSAAGGGGGGSVWTATGFNATAGGATCRGVAIGVDAGANEILLTVRSGVGIQRKVGAGTPTTVSTLTTAGSPLPHFLWPNNTGVGTNAGVVYCSCDVGLLRSSDYGATWSNIVAWANSSDNCGSLHADPVDNTILYTTKDDGIAGNTGLHKITGATGTPTLTKIGPSTISPGPCAVDPTTGVVYLAINAVVGTTPALYASPTRNPDGATVFTDLTDDAWRNGPFAPKDMVVLGDGTILVGSKQNSDFVATVSGAGPGGGTGISYAGISGSDAFTGSSRDIDISGVPDGARVYCGVFVVKVEAPLVFPGWTLVLEGDQSTVSHYALFRREKQPGDSTFSVSWGTAAHTVLVWAAYQGQDDTTPDEEAAFLEASSTTAATPQLTPNEVGTWALALFYLRSTAGTVDFSGATISGMTLRESPAYTAGSAYIGAALADSADIVTQDTHAYQATATNGSAGGGILLFLRPGAGLTDTATAAETLSLARTIGEQATATDTLSRTTAGGTTPTLSQAATATDSLTADGAHVLAELAVGVQQAAVDAALILAENAAAADALAKPMADTAVATDRPVIDTLAAEAPSATDVLVLAAGGMATSGLFIFAQTPFAEPAAAAEVLPFGISGSLPVTLGEGAAVVDVLVKSGLPKTLSDVATANDGGGGQGLAPQAPQPPEPVLLQRIRGKALVG